ncbi:AMP-binding protein [Parendozoicomonas callyspongiae]|uniref:AMP-binding protein n=1 Tax=Parendozoicomonas callyspongiae TaxID=2942213 RepID=UPI0038CD6B06
MPYKSVLGVLKWSSKRFASYPAFSNLGHTITFGELDELSSHFAGWIKKETNLSPGDRIAIQLPNVMQFPVTTFGALKAGLIVVNTNPLYTEAEMEHQFQDSGAQALVVLANARQGMMMVGRDIVEGKSCWWPPLPLYHIYSFTVLVGLNTYLMGC